MGSLRIANKKPKTNQFCVKNNELVLELGYAAHV